MKIETIFSCHRGSIMTGEIFEDNGKRFLNVSIVSFFKLASCDTTLSHQTHYYKKILYVMA